MKIEQIIELWNEDTDIDKTELSDEALKIPKLHSKYYQILVHERLLLRKYEADFKILKLEKFEFYSQGPNEETKKKGWRLPPKGLILKAEVPTYLEADQDLIDLSLRIGMQNEKVAFLDSIIKSIMNRGYIVRSAIDFIKFTNGC